LANGKDLSLALTRLFSTWRHHDPAPKSQIALPVAVFKKISETECGSTTPKRQATGDLILIAFFFLLRVGEYTVPTIKRRTRTVQFRLRDVTFWKNHKRLPTTASDAELLAADAATLQIDNQKNGHRDDTLHHEKVDGDLDPVSALARRYIAARQASHSYPDALLCQFGPTSFISAAMITATLRRACLQCDLSAQGFAQARIGSHSIRASGAMALYLNNVPTTTIRKLGRWRSETWLTYIHNQIAELTVGISTIMTRNILFHNVSVRAP
jgi:hypothetical protein